MASVVGVVGKRWPVLKANAAGTALRKRALVPVRAYFRTGTHPVTSAENGPAFLLCPQKGDRLPNSSKD